ncbi:uncharacterized protein LOC126842328 [Adelges cooleyi]|uniref:uncharacterized protein LOC126842328 n=1 Tax=Adelges cooleyi TaxID=133065 RepID=UPI00217FA68B|nr:uncharacterized protein LOC126842328 [Adelges cooleyi]
MRPIIVILSQRNTEENEISIKNYNLSREVFVDKIASYFTEMFLDKKEVLEVLKVVGHNEKLPIESKEYRKIIKMLTASLRMARIHKDYKTNGDPNVNFLHYIRKHWLFSDESAYIIPKLENRRMININPNLNNLSTNYWKTIFNQYDSDNNGLISETELQKLFYEVFQVFITIRNARKYIRALISQTPKSEESNNIRLKQLKKMRPILFVLSQRDPEGNENNKISREVFVDKIASYFTEMFLDKKEVLEVLKIGGHDEKSLIEWTEYHEIIKMLTASLRMARIHKYFCLTNDDPDIDILQYIRKHWLARDESASLITNLDKPLMSNINPNLNNLSTNDWKKIFDQYDSDNVGSISATELQKLLYEKFKVFITIRQAEEYTYLINLQENHKIELEHGKKTEPILNVKLNQEIGMEHGGKIEPIINEKINHEIGLEHVEKKGPILNGKINYEIGFDYVEKMEPIICILSQRKIEEKNESFIKNNQILTDDFVNIMSEKFPAVFLDKKEVLEVLKVVGHDEKLPIALTEYHEIVKMLPASQRMAHIYIDYSYKDGINKYEALVSFPTWIRRSRLYREIPGSFAFQLQNQLKSVICL